MFRLDFMSYCQHRFQASKFFKKTITDHPLFDEFTFHHFKAKPARKHLGDDMFKINNSYESDPSTGSSVSDFLIFHFENGKKMIKFKNECTSNMPYIVSYFMQSLDGNDLTTTATTTPPPTLNTEWDFQSGTALKDYLFPSESNNSADHTFGKSSNSNQHHHRNHRQPNKSDRSMVNSSQESDFCGFTPTPALDVENANACLEKIPENLSIANDEYDGADDAIGTTEEHHTRHQDEMTTTTTRLGQHRLREKLCSTISEYGLEQTHASEEFSDQDVRCQIEMANNEQQLEARMSNVAVDECNDTHLTIEPTSSDEDENDESLYYLGSPPAAVHKDREEAEATATAAASTITNFHTHCTLDEDSNNAVDNAISNEQCTIGGSSTPKDLSFNGKLTKLQPSINESNVMPSNSNNDSHEKEDLTTTMINEKSSLKLQLQLETSREHINERSPDLFSEMGDFDATENEEAIQDNDIAAAAAATTTAADEDDDLGTDVSGINDSADIKTDDGSPNTVLSDKHIEKTERALNKRIQSLLTGIIPPPSVTFVQHDVADLLATYQRNITLMDVPSFITCNNNEKQTEETCDDVADAIPEMPKELEHIEWPQLKRANAFGVHYNRTKYTDNIEIMYMKLVERYVGQETVSSFTHSAKDDASAAAAAKKKPMRKLYVRFCKSLIFGIFSSKLTKKHWFLYLLSIRMSSPGNRLSHLARRRAIFSAANLQSQSSQPQLSGQSKLGQKTCVINAS